MIVCPACDHRNSEDRETCEQCGGSLERFVYRACPACDALNPAQNTFCQRCLTELAAASGELPNTEDTPDSDEAAQAIPWPPKSPQETVSFVITPDTVEHPTDNSTEDAAELVSTANDGDDASLDTLAIDRDIVADELVTDAETLGATAETTPLIHETPSTVEFASIDQTEFEESNEQVVDDRLSLLDEVPAISETEEPVPSSPDFAPQAVDTPQTESNSDSVPDSVDDQTLALIADMRLDSLDVDPNASAVPEIETTAVDEVLAEKTPETTDEPIEPSTSQVVIADVASDDESLDLDATIEDILSAMPDARPVESNAESLDHNGVAQIDDTEIHVLVDQDDSRLAEIEISPSAGLPTARPEDIRAIISDPQQSPLDDVEDAIPLEMSVSLPHRSTPVIASPPTEASQYEADLFQQVANETPRLIQRTQQATPKVSRAMPGWLKTILYVAVLLAALIPFVSGGLTTPWIQPRDAVVAMVREVDELPAGSTVLISFDYTPAYAEELSPLASAVVQQLAENSVQILAMSTKPGGVGIADQVLQSQTVYRDPQSYGSDYLLLGYLAGEENGLRSLSGSLDAAFRSDAISNRPLSTLSITQNQTTINDLAMIILLADDQKSVRSWVEQVGQRYDIPLSALTTSRIEPSVTPYMHSGQLANLIAGAPGAVEYSAMLGTVAYDGRSSDAYAVYFVILLLIVVISNALYLSGADRPKRVRTKE